MVYHGFPTHDGGVLGASNPAESVRRTFRRILSGEPHGRPSWIRALEDPGDAGWFGPGSAIWSVHGSMSTLVGGIRALLLQTAHPLALAGVEQHSDYRSDALGRLQRTNRFVTTVTFGSSAQALAAVERVQRAHAPVVGSAPDGRSYAASDPHLLAWVHTALADSFLSAAQALGPKGVDADAYVADMAVVGKALDVEDPPATAAELRGRMESFRPELAGSATARDVVRFLENPPLPLVARPAYQVLQRAAADLLPNWAHPVLGTPVRPAPVRLVDVAAVDALLRSLALVLGARGPGERAARSRLG
ncbi:MAG: oxygenase MpaB family protein [Candidatus Nanopelagicales bacterium]